MKQFKDNAGDTWRIEITAGTVKRVLDVLKVDLGKPLDGQPKPVDPHEHRRDKYLGRGENPHPPLLARIGTDILFLVDLLFVICQPEAEKRGVSDVQFGERLGGQAIADAHAALMEDLADFFHVLRPDIAETIRKQHRIVQKAADAARRQIAGDGFDKEVDAMIAAKAKRLGISVASTPPSPDAGPSPEPSASLS